MWYIAKWDGYPRKMQIICHASAFTRDNGSVAGASPHGPPAVSRPEGFHNFTKRQGFHSLYLVAVEEAAPIKVGIAADPANRFLSIQCSNFLLLRLHRYWWLPGRQISFRIENHFKKHFQPRCVRGEWFDMPLSQAESFIESSIRKLGVWSAGDAEIIELMDYYARRRLAIPPEAPTPLRGFGPRRLPTVAQ